MASGWTDKGAYQVLGGYFRGETIPTTFDLRLVTDAVAPNSDTTVFSALTEVTAGTGYTADGASLARNSTVWDVWNENAGSADVELADVTWTASGGSISGARHAVLCNDTSGGTAEVYAYFDLTENRTVTDGQALTLQNCKLTITVP